MNVEVLPAAMEDETTFRNLYQFYMYEFSRYMGWDTNYAGQFPQDDLDGCWSDRYVHPFLVKTGGKWAGLAIVETHDKSYFSYEDDIHHMGEFFIMGAYQKKGIGEQVATHLFDRFPSKWEVFELTQNVNAQAFWRKVIGRYTNENYRERSNNRGVVQIFDNTRT
jgi:predicted acetyltransferase